MCPRPLFAVANHDLNDLGLQKCGDKNALAALYNATDGANWTDKTNWLSEKPSAIGMGSRLIPTARVTKLILNSNNLNGTLPAELGNLSNLRHLHLHSNQLSGSIPKAWGLPQQPEGAAPP